MGPWRDSVSTNHAMSAYNWFISPFTVRQTDNSSDALTTIFTDNYLLYCIQLLCHKVSILVLNGRCIRWYSKDGRAQCMGRCDRRIIAWSVNHFITRYKQAGDYSCRYLHVAACTGENTYHNYTNLTKVKLALIHIWKNVTGGCQKFVLWLQDGQ